MAEVPSTFTLEAGQKAPGFELPDAQGAMHSLESVMGKKGTLVIFACNHCPFVIHLAKEVGAMAAEMKDWGVSTVAISANDIEKYPQDAPDKMAEFAKEYGWDFPYLYDESQGVAKSYYAACTPDFFLLDGDGCLYYAGQFDDSRPKNSLPVDGKDLKIAIRDLLEDAPASTATRPATGCNIKWKPGNEPSYFG
ncbi:Peroxiredoxin [Rubritalea squalenifaciens DSM 18772]|uniref:Peroxiredoxin n=1 Tax=Rubritalea squalenifaciens DSM 18772 TaxID=1123071 RepID=A0A1M6MDP0_9BACT|nr:thioredoxin family protein [Rubritalea squalenifaciens]SHJ81567.1 Peroxiredoxin [Rubritalea squalenifaciens DSM 18772]